jgi:hypothetical protein
MSKSRRFPRNTDKWNGRSREKHRSNKKVRKLVIEEVPHEDGWYKNIYDSWNICDWNFFDPSNPKVYRK